MDSDTPQLPLINFSDQTLKTGSSKWVEVRSDVRKALEDYGCFQVSYDIMSMELQDSILAAMKTLFELPVEIKQRNIYEKPFAGYLIHTALSESLGINEANVLEKANEFTQKLWPGEGNETISKTIQKFAEKLAEIDVMVRRMVMESFGVEKYIEEHLNSTSYRVRLMKYIAPPDTNADDVHVGDDVNANADDGHGHVGANVHASDDVTVNADHDSHVGVHADDDVHGGSNVVANANGDDGHVGVEASDDVKANAHDGNVGVKGDDVNANGDEVDAITDLVGDINLNIDADADANANVDVKVEADHDHDEEEDEKLGLHSHTDKNLITIIFQHEIEGLEVKTKDEKWIRVKATPNTFVVIAGDCLCALTNGRISASYHRVRVTEKKKTRYSAALFTQPKLGFLVDSPQELVDEMHPRVFKPFDYIDLMGIYHTEAGRSVQSALHAYFAVAGT